MATEMISSEKFHLGCVVFLPVQHFLKTLSILQVHQQKILQSAKKMYLLKFCSELWKFHGFVLAPRVGTLMLNSLRVCILR